MQIGISVIICCYNSAHRLPETLRHLALQCFTTAISWEVIVVNNNSSDNTVSVAKSEWAKYNITIPLRIIEEPEPGLSNARKAGIYAANYAISIFCDDDNWLSNNYLQVSFDIMNSSKSIGLLGSEGFPVVETNEPNWFEAKKEGYAVGKQCNIEGNVTSKGSLWGAGLVLRTNVLTKIFDAGVQSLLSDRKGKELSSGGDSEICVWYIFAGYQLWYTEKISFHHYISKERLTREYCDHLFSGFNKANSIYHKYMKVVNYKKDGYSLLSLLTDLVRVSVFSLQPNKKTYKELAIERIQFKVGESICLNNSIYQILRYKRIISSLKL